MTTSTPALNNAMEIAAQSLHHMAEAHTRATTPDTLLPAWNDIPEPARRSYRVLAQKAAESATFDDFYAFTTLAERLAGLSYPDASHDTERTRGARAQYHLVKFLGSLETGDSE
ncbi:hypothetical protein ACIQHU_39195 [Streptomyces tendae]|uniref:hypothetical protein n=1 Tax=Streptomyces tendae TaxID=1932 RepID=UPI0038268E8D